MAGTDLLTKRNILVPVDNTDDSEKAVEWALDNVFRTGDQVHLLVVIAHQHQDVVAGLDTSVSVPILIDDDPKVEKQHEQEAEAFVRKRFTPLLEKKGANFTVEIVKFLTDNDSISNVICKRAEDLNAVCVVIASHNKSKLSEFFLGSVSNNVAHQCKQPVTVIKG